MEKVIANEKGTALVLALLVMTILTVFALAAVNVTNTGLVVTADYKVKQASLHTADSGSDYGHGFVSRAIASGQAVSSTDSSSTNVTIDATDTDSDGITDLEAELKGMVSSSSDSYSDSPPDIQLVVIDDTINIDVDFVRSRQMPGASSEFASRYEGIGGGGAGGFGLYYRVESSFTDSAGKSTTVRITYRCVEGGGRCL